LEDIIRDIYKSKLEADRKKSDEDELIKRIYQLALEEGIPEQSHVEVLLYKAGDYGRELGFFEGFKAAVRLMAECLL